MPKVAHFIGKIEGVPKTVCFYYWECSLHLKTIACPDGRLWCLNGTSTCPSGQVFTIPHKIWSDLIRIFRLSLPAIASQTAQKISDQICSELPDLISSVRSKSNQILIRFWTDLIQHHIILSTNYIYSTILCILSTNYIYSSIIFI